MEAEPYSVGIEDGSDLCDNMMHCKHKYNCTNCDRRKPFISTLEGKMYIAPTDYIITGVAGERYPCKKDIFEGTYEDASIPSTLELENVELRAEIKYLNDLVARFGISK